jgi:Holliday junction DNA helicase RuvB
MIESSSENTITPKVASQEETQLDQSLRPKSLREFIGQESLKANLAVVLEAAAGRGDTLEHILLYGPPGLGKTTLAFIIGKETGSNVKTTSGPAIERAGDLASLLTSLEEGDVLFIDEIHRLNKVVEEILYPAMEDGVLDIVLGKGPGARSIRMELPHFTLIGATTRIGLLSAPLRDRFGLTYHLDYYELPALEQIVSRSSTLLGTTLDAGATTELAKRSRFTPRIANRLLKRLRDFAQVGGHATITETVALEALERLEIDSLGLDRHDRRILEILIDKFGGGPVGLSTLAMAANEEEDTLTSLHEPFLIRLGLIERTPKGRAATKSAYTHLGKVVPPSKQQLL